MYTRSRQSQGYTNNARNQPNQNMGYQGQAAYNQQGNYQGQQTPANQQGNYKQGNAQGNQGFKPQQQGQVQQQGQGQQGQQQQGQQQQQQQQQQSSPQGPQAAARNMQQMKPQLTQLQLQQQQLKQQQQQQQQPPLPNTPQPQRLKPILKQSAHPQQPGTPGTPGVPQPQSALTPPAPTPTPAPTSLSMATPALNAGDMKTESEQSENMDTDMQDQIPRWRRKVPGFRVNKRLKRLRLNQRLRKTLQPKNAIMVLNEMKAGVQFTFPETQGPMPNSLYLVHAELDGKTYVGKGLSKPLARQDAAENALKALLLEKMTAASIKARIDAETDGQLNQSAEGSIASTKDDNSEEGSSTPMDTNADENDEIPWSSLASFALYKLFLEWHNQGTSVPVPRPGVPSPVKAAKKEAPNTQKAAVQKELPPNATSIHPVMLLNQMRPGLAYVELNRIGNPPNILFTLAVEIDGVEYSGTAKNKKDAKKIAAKSALLALHGLIYPDDGTTVKDQPMEAQMG